MRVTVTKLCHSCIPCAALWHGRSQCNHQEKSALREERDRLMESLKLTVYYIASLARLRGFLSPEEQLIIAAS